MKSKLTIHQQIAIRDAEENPQPKKRAFGGKKQYYYVKGFKVNKEIWYQLLKKLLDYFGKKLTKEGAAQIAKKAIPVLGAAISGGLTLTTFSIENKRLQKKLKEEQEFSDSLNNHFIISTGILK